MKQLMHAIPFITIVSETMVMNGIACMRVSHCPVLIAASDQNQAVCGTN